MQPALGAERVLELIDEGFRSKRRNHRAYLGGSRLGESCDRKLFYEVAKPDSAAPFEPRTMRIFDRGHALEDVAARWLQGSGLELLTESPKTGEQFAFEDCDGRIAGHADGIAIGGAGGWSAAAFPFLWEHKALGSRGFGKLQSLGVARAYPVYAGQIATYQGYLKLAANPALFTAVNSDTMELYVELVPFDAAKAQECVDRGIRVLDAVDADEPPPRPYSTPEHFGCRFCNFKAHCWGA